MLGQTDAGITQIAVGDQPDVFAAEYLCIQIKPPCKIHHDRFERITCMGREEFRERFVTPVLYLFLPE